MCVPYVSTRCGFAGILARGETSPEPKVPMTCDLIRRCILAAALLAAAALAQAQTPAVTAAPAPQAAADTRLPAQLSEAGADLQLPGGTLQLRAVSGNVLRLHFVPEAGETAPTLVMAPAAAHPPAPRSKK